MGWGMERRLLLSRSGEPLLAVNPQSGVWVSGGERLLAEAIRAFAPGLDETHHKCTEIDPGFWPRFNRVSASRESPGAGVCRQLKSETVLVVNNLSSSAQAVELDLRRYKGNILVEMFGRNIFPRVGDLPY